jgi:hypothetical protein
MRLSAVAVLSLAVTLFVVSFASLLLSGCVTSLECGSWAFNGTPQSYPETFPLSSAFTFTPAACGKSCDCDSDVMIQIVRVYDSENQTYVYPTSSQAARATTDGWAIDRVDGSAYGWYSLLNDGKTFLPFWNTPGSNGTPNTLYDNPSNWPNNTVFFALDAAVCFTSKTCNNRVLGYYFWSWTTDNNGNATTLITSTAWTNLESEFQSALATWNAWAPSSGMEDEGAIPNAPPQPTLPSAVQFPALTDL